MCRSWVVPEYPCDPDEDLTRRAWNYSHLQRAILDAALEVLAARGARAFTVTEVAEHSGVARTTIYKYFDLKAGLLAACRDYLGFRRWPAFRRVALQERVALSRGRGSHIEILTKTLSGLSNGTDPEDPLAQARELMLLAGAEGVRSKRQPRRFENWLLPGAGVKEVTGDTETEATPPPVWEWIPVPPRYQSELGQLVRTAQRAGEMNTRTEAGTVAKWLTALWWYDCFRRGPLCDEKQVDDPLWRELLPLQRIA